MSKIGKRDILLLLALPIGFNVMAKETKKPTLEELIPGGESSSHCLTEPAINALDSCNDG